MLPAVGRFISEDPIRFRAGINMYGYALNDPVYFTDPTGLASEYGFLPGTDIPYRIDWNQKPYPNMHVTWRDGAESVITHEGGWVVK